MNWPSSLEFWHWVNHSTYVCMYVSIYIYIYIYIYMELRWRCTRRHVDWYLWKKVSEKRVASIWFWSCWRCSSKTLDNYIPFYMASYLRILESSSTTLWEPQNSPTFFLIAYVLQFCIFSFVLFYITSWNMSTYVFILSSRQDTAGRLHSFTV
jgi:hypothetical protein